MQAIQDIINVGFSLHQEGKLDEAENAYNEALKIDSKNAEVYNLIGVLKLQQDEVESAIEYIEKAIEISPEAYFYETLFQAYIRSENYESIVSRAEFVQRLFPNNFSLMFNLGLAYKNLNKNKEPMCSHKISEC